MLLSTDSHRTTLQRGPSIFNPRKLKLRTGEDVLWSHYGTWQARCMRCLESGFFQLSPLPTLLSVPVRGWCDRIASGTYWNPVNNYRPHYGPNPVPNYGVPSNS